MKPLAIDLFCGLGGWTEGLLEEGYDVLGFDIERHEYGDAKYPAQLCLYDVLAIHGSMFRDAALIVASPPCQAYSYRAMPWKRAKALPPPCNALFDACFRIQREASEAAGRKIPLVVENVRGAQPWVGRAAWHYGSFYLWGDVPALMPMTVRAVKVGGLDWEHPSDPRHRPGQAFNPAAQSKALREERGQKNNGGSWINIGSPGQKVVGCNPDGRKQPGISGPRANGKGDAWFQDGAAKHGSKSSARKAASALIAKIPLPLARHVGRMWQPRDVA